MHKFVETGRLERRPLQGCTIDFQEFMARRGRRPVRRWGWIFVEFDGATGRPGVRPVQKRCFRTSHDYHRTSAVEIGHHASLIER